MRKKILIIAMAYYPRFIGGAEIALKELTDRLSDEYDFHMVTLRYSSDLPRVSKEGSVLVHRIGPGLSGASVANLRNVKFRILKMWFQLAAFFKARALQRAEKYDAIWGMMAHSAGVPAGLFKRFNPEIPYVLSLQEGDPPLHIERQMRIFGPLFRSAFTGADMVQSLSVFLGDWGLRMGARDIAVIPNGVEVARFKSEHIHAHREELRRKFAIGEEAPLLITVSRLVPKNGIDVVIDSFSSLPKDLHFLIAGAGPQLKALKRQVAEKGLEGRVHFAGEIPQQKVPFYLGAADIFIRASRSEGQGISFIEAMASGLPTIGTAVGGIPDFLHEGKTGFVAEVCDAKSVAGAILRALENPKTTAAIAAAGRTLAQAYDWDHIAERMREEVFKPLWKKK